MILSSLTVYERIRPLQQEDSQPCKTPNPKHASLSPVNLQSLHLCIDNEETDVK
jgi:hypothetical protein